uniref:Uncharacterized protein n=1 Tax=Steinernema glaseri TaxID=37863 RepID=A0A1I7YQ79_9BILA
MNRLPFALSAAKKLCGNYGRLAQLQHVARCSGDFSFDVNFTEAVQPIDSPKGLDVQIPVVPYLESTIESAIHEAPVIEHHFALSLMNPDVSQKRTPIFPHDRYRFALYSQSISGPWVDFACSLKMPSAIAITEKLDEEGIRLFRRIVTAKKLFALKINSQVCNEAAVEIVKSLICQDQFEALTISNDDSEAFHGKEDKMVQRMPSVVRELLRLWPENSEKLRGKSLIMWNGGVHSIMAFLVQKALAADSAKGIKGIEDVLKICSKEECDFIDKEYKHSEYTFERPSCVYKFEDGEESNRRRIYLSFECADQAGQEGSQQMAANHNGMDDIRLLGRTSHLHVLFG